MFLLVHGHFEENCIPDGFLFKRGFQIRMKKGTQVLSIDIPCHLHYVLGSPCVLLFLQRHASTHLAVPPPHQKVLRHALPNNSTMSIVI